MSVCENIMLYFLQNIACHSKSLYPNPGCLPITHNFKVLEAFYISLKQISVHMFGHTFIFKIYQIL